MKGLFWSLLMMLLGAIGIWFITSRRRDVLYGEVSRLREIERKYNPQLEKELAELKAHQAKIRKHNEERLKSHEEFYQTLPVEEQIDIAMRQAEWKFNDSSDIASDTESVEEDEE